MTNKEKKNNSSQDSDKQVPEQKSESLTTKQYTYEEQNKIFNEGLEAADKYEALLMEETLQEMKKLFKPNQTIEIISAEKIATEMILLNLQKRHLGYLKSNQINDDGNFEKMNLVKNLRHEIDVCDLKLFVLSNKRVHPNNWDEVNKIINNYSPEYISLILGGSSCSETKKINRLQAQIDYASKNKPIYEKLKKYLLNLKDDEWHLYKGDKPSDVSFF